MMRARLTAAALNNGNFPGSPYGTGPHPCAGLTRTRGNYYLRPNWAAIEKAENEYWASLAGPVTTRKVNPT